MEFKPICSQASSVKWRITWGMGTTVEFWNAIALSIYLNSWATGTRSLLGAIILLSYRHLLGCLPVSYILYLQGVCRMGEVGILTATQKENILCKSTTTFGDVLVPYGTIQLWNANLTEQALHRQPNVLCLAVISHFLGTALGNIQHMPA